MGRTFTHLTYEQRVEIKKLLDKGESKRSIADKFGVHVSTIYNEIERGMQNGQYVPQYAEELYRNNLSEKGPKAKLDIDKELAQHIAEMILNQEMSPKQIEMQLKKDPQYASRYISAQTIYLNIDKGKIPGVTRETLRTEEVTVYNDGQICIPKWVREKLQIKDGDIMHLEITKSGKIVYQKVKTKK